MTVIQGRFGADDWPTLVASNVRAEAARRGYSASDLARALKMDRSSIGMRWRGERQWQLEDLERVARLFGIAPWDLTRVDGGWAHRGSNPEPAD